MGWPIRAWKNPITTAAIVGISGVAGSYAAVGISSKFIVAPVNSIVVNTTPAPIVTFSILILGKVGELIGFSIALIFLTTILGSFSVVAQRISPNLPLQILLTMILGYSLSILLTQNIAASLGTGLGMGISIGIRSEKSEPETTTAMRRRFLEEVFSLTALGALAGVHGTTRSSATDNSLSENPMKSHEAEIDHRLANARDISMDIENLPGLVSNADNFYEVDINSINPEISAESWELCVTGEVENELALSYSDLLSLQAEHRFVTLRCVSDPLDGQLIDNALWTGIPTRRILSRAIPSNGCECVLLRAADDYTVEFPIEAFEAGLLAYGMNGEILPQEHGYPLRALVPGHWGETNAKWLTDIEVLDRDREGYWEKRGWHGTGPVNTIAKIWTVNRLGGGRIQIAGFAYAGTRGISKVEVLPDLGKGWREATIGKPLSGRDTWRQWSYEWTPKREKGKYTTMARAVDERGERQLPKHSEPYPSGATGYDQRTITIGDAGDPYMPLE